MVSVDLPTLFGRGAARDSADAAATPVELPGLIVRVGVWVAIVGFAAQGVADIVGFIWFDGTVDQLSADEEFTIWSWASSTATACAALAAGLLAVAHGGRRGTYLLLAAILAFFSADDMLQIHERLHANLGGAEETTRIVFPVVYLPLLVASFLLLWRCAAHACGPASRSIRLGLLMLVAAIGCEVVSFGMVQIGLNRGTFAYELEVIVEEGLELAGWILISSGLLAGLVDRTTRMSR